MTMCQHIIFVCSAQSLKMESAGKPVIPAPARLLCFILEVSLFGREEHPCGHTEIVRTAVSGIFLVNFVRELQCG